MEPLHFIQEKRDGRHHSTQMIQEFITALTEGQVPDYQTAAWLMAVYFQGLDWEETRALTLAMANSGQILKLSRGPTLDKHSSGGVGDKTSLIVIPILAAAGAVVAKMSGRGLGHTGGTIDKLEAIPGLRTELSLPELQRQAEQIGLAIAAQSPELAPADGIIYSLRDVTATVESLPLIASSILSKKLASGADNIIFDIKAGSGALLPLEQARELAEMLVNLALSLGKNSSAILSSMDQPLGQAVGNALEVEEAWATLNGQGPEDLVTLGLALARAGLKLCGLPPERAQEALSSGAAREKFLALVQAQGGDAALLMAGLPLAPRVTPVTAAREGFVAEVAARRVAEAALNLGAGRKRKGEAIDLGVGVVIKKKIGQWVEAGEVLAEIYSRGQGEAQARMALEQAFLVSPDPVRPPELILEQVEL